MLSLHLRLVLHCLLFSSFFFLLFLFPETQMFTERYPTKPLWPQRSVICRVTPSYNWSSFCYISYFIVGISPGPELMCIEPLWAFIFWCMGDHNPADMSCLGTYLAGQKDMWRYHRFEQSWEQLMAHPLAPCCSTFSQTVHRWACPLTKASTKCQVKGWEKLQEPDTRFRLRNRNLGDKAHVWVLPSIPEPRPTERKPWIEIICLLQFKGWASAISFCQES